MNLVLRTMVWVSCDTIVMQQGRNMERDLRKREYWACVQT